MKKIIILLLIFQGFYFFAKANHITGGEMFYTYTGFLNGQYKYHVTLKLFMRCNSGRQFSNPTIVSIFNRSTNNRVSDLSVPLASQETISLNSTNPCITNPPTVCYEVAYYHFTYPYLEAPTDILLPARLTLE